MFSRVLKSSSSQQQQQQQQQQASMPPAAVPPSTPTKTRSSAAAPTPSSQARSAAPPPPSKIPVPTTPSRSSRSGEPHSKENLPANGGAQQERSNYLSFLFAQSQAGAPTTPVKVKATSQSSNPAAAASSAAAHSSSHVAYDPFAQQQQHAQYGQYAQDRSSAYAHGQQQQQQYHQHAASAHQSTSRHQYESDDVHMQTMKNTVHPAMLKSLASMPAAAAPAPPPKAAQQHPAAQRSNLHPQTAYGSSYAVQQQQQQQQHDYHHALQPVHEDVHMRTIARNDQPKERGLQPWERELLDKQETKRKATVAQIYFLDYYFDLLGYISHRKKRLDTFKKDTSERQVHGEAYARELMSYNGRERVLLRKRRTKLRVEQFRIIAQVGQGGYGSVYLARKADTNEICALKKMRKATLAKMDEVQHVLVERDILCAVKTPWLVRLLYAFQDKEHVYLAMEYVPGGDFRTLLNNSGVLKEEHARFYAAEMFAGLNELHKLGYIHRDLKPENFLVDSTGHVKLTDFGLAAGALNPQRIDSMRQKLDQVKDENLVFRSTLERRTIYRSMRMAEPRYADSVVGSPDYMPPEVLRGKTYTFSADYWSLGCILFEFLCGFPPFSGSTPEETWANLKNWTKVLRRPVYDRPEDLIFNLSDISWDVVTRLIAHPKDRFSSLQDIQSHPFFTPLPFGSLRELPAPFVPVLDGETDVGYFDSFESAEDMAKYAEVFKKQRDVEAVEERGIGARNNWVGFTFGKNAAGVAPLARGIKADNEPLATMF